MSGLLLIILVALIFLVLYQLGRSSEMIATLQGEREFDLKRNKWLGYSMLGVFAVFMIGIVWCHLYMLPLIKDMRIAASDHAVEYDSMFFWTLVITGIVFFITQFLCFWFAFRYRDNGKNKPVFFAHSNKLEMIWTTIPALAMAVLVAIGLKAWFTMTGPVPAGEDKQIVEVIGRQFGWITRYPGKDGVIGKRYFKNINDANNILGMDWTDSTCMDDIVMPTGELRLIVNKPVELIIGSRDVIHDVGLAHFRMKVDAVPGITTRMWFTPTITTDSMKQITKNPEFVYELSCDQMCGVGHYSMRAIVIVETQAEHDKWLAEQKTYYELGHPEEFETEEAEAETEGDEAKEEEEKTVAKG